MRGWIIDCYEDDDDGAAVLWFRTPERTLRISDRGHRQSFFVSGPDLPALANDLEGKGAWVSRTKARTSLGGGMEEVLEVGVEGRRQLMRLARTVDRWGDHRRYRLYNVDLRMGQRYLLPRELFPMGLAEYDGGTMRMLESRLRIDYPTPHLNSMHVSLPSSSFLGPYDEGPIRSLDVDGLTIDGREEDILRDLASLVERRDPDMIVMERGDKVGMGHIHRRAAALGLEGFHLGRDKGLREKEERSYQSYGQTVYRPGAKMLRGRIHVDTSSFMYREGGMDGITDLSRICGMPPQELMRVTPGTAISSMQIDEALRTGHLVAWKKNRPEDFKTARQLLGSDRGGTIHQPVVGIHEDVTELDFSSLYPSIIVRFNISPETVECDCCPSSRMTVPGLGYRICEAREGLLPKVIRPVIERRRTFKRLAMERPWRRQAYEGRAKVLKWLLVTCFGYTGYRNARFGRIECHESITAYGREILLRSTEMAEESGFRILHGIVDSLWIQGDGETEAFRRSVGREYGIPLEEEGRYRWIVFLPNLHNGMGALNRYYGAFLDGNVKMRGIAARKRDCVPMVRDFQTTALDILAKAEGADGFRECIPDVLEALRDSHGRVMSGSVPRQDLVLCRRVSRPRNTYRQMNATAAALDCLLDRGHSPHPGESVLYVMKDSSSKDPTGKVTVMDLDGQGDYDRGYYGALLVRSAEELLSPFGWDRDGLERMLRVRG